MNYDLSNNVSVEQLSVTSVTTPTNYTSSLKPDCLSGCQLSRTSEDTESSSSIERFGAFPKVNLNVSPLSMTLRIS